MSCCQCRGIERIFAGGYVRRELRKYRRKGPGKTSRLLIGALEAEGVEGATLIDIGGGVGAIQYALLDAGADRVTSAEAAGDYLAAAREEAARQGYAERITYHYGDFVELAGEIEGADVVTLDRVICCYPDMESLVTLSVERARRLYGLVYPRVTWWTKIGFRALNAVLWITRTPFRVFLHPPDAVEKLIRRAGFEPRFHARTLNWQVFVYAR